MEMLLFQYAQELFAVIAITVLTIVTPGPDFIIVARNSLSFSRRSGIYTAVGVSTAVWVHIFYTLAGIGLILSKSILLFSLVKMLGAVYLLYLGISCIRSKGNVGQLGPVRKEASPNDFKSFQMGFINNILNPKATLFFVSLFTQLVSPSTPLFIQIVYGAIVSASCLVWFSLVAIFLNRNSVKQTFFRVQKTVEKIMGVVLVAFGIKMALSTSN